VKDLAQVLVPGRTQILVNVNEERDRLAGKTEQQERFFRELGVACGLSFNVYRPDPGLDFLIDLVLRHQLRRVIRVGLAHPIADERNVFLAPEHYPEVAARLAEFARRCDQQRIHLSLDCGFTLKALGIAQRAGIETGMVYVVHRHAVREAERAYRFFSNHPDVTRIHYNPLYAEGRARAGPPWSSGSLPQTGARSSSGSGGCGSGMASAAPSPRSASSAAPTSGGSSSR
jgi:hypothetical protein